MTINKIGFEEEGITLLGYTVNNGNIKASYFESENGNTQFYNTTAGNLNLTIKLYITAGSREELYTKVSETISRFSGEFLISFDNEISYKAIYQKHNQEVITPTDLILTIETIAGRYGGKIKYSLSGNTSYEVIVNCSKEVKPIITITSTTAKESIEIMGITISNVEANIPVVINSEDYTIFAGTANKILDSNIISFPTLKTGKNTITTNDSSLSIQIEFTKAYI